MEKKNNIKKELAASHITNPYLAESELSVSPMLEAMNAVSAFRNTGNATDPLGMWTGVPDENESRPVQDADDL